MGPNLSTIDENYPDINQLIYDLDQLIYADNVSADDFAFADDMYEKYKQSLTPVSTSKLLELNGLLNYLSGNHADALFYFSEAEASFSVEEYFASNLAHAFVSEANAIKKAKRRRLITRSVIASGILIYISFAVWSDSDSGVMVFAEPSMVAMAESAGMSTKGKATFLRADPALVSTTEIQELCSSGTVSEGRKLGCYIPSENKIYIRDMPSEFDDMEIVTASHEMLHAASHRFGIPEDIISTLNSQKRRSLKDEYFKASLDAYSTLEGEDEIEELHSIVGTELGQLPEDLSEYYSEFFEYRLLTLAANKKTYAVFESKEKSLEKLDKRIDESFSKAESYYGSHSYAASVGDRYSSDYYWNLYANEYDKQEKLIAQYNAELESYKTLAKQYNGESFDPKSIPIAIPLQR